MQEQKKIYFCSLTELMNKKKITKFLDEFQDEISVFWMNGTPKAVSTICPHFGGEFDYDSKNEILRCQWHGWKFDLNTCQSLAKADLYEETSLVGKILKTAKEPLGCFPFRGKLQQYDLDIKEDAVSIIYNSEIKKES